MRPEFLLLVAVVFAGLAVRRPVWALAGLVIAAPAYLLRATVAGLPTTALEAAVLGTLVGWLVAVGLEAGRSRGSLQERWSRLGQVLPVGLRWLLILTLLGWLASTAVSIDPRASLGALKAWFIEPLVIGGLLLIELRTERDRRVVERALLLALAWVSIAGLLQLAVAPGSVEDGRLSSVFAPVANYFAMFAAPLIVLAIGMVMLGRDRLYATLAAAAGLIALGLSFSYGGFLAVAVGLVVLALVALDSRRRRQALMAILVIGVAGFTALLPSRHFREKLNFTTRSSSLVRTQIWRTALDIGVAHPVFGVGPNTFESAYREAVPRRYFPPLEWLVAQPHELYLALWLETGVLGLIGTVGFLGLLLRRSFRSIELAPKVAAAALVAVLAHGLVDTPLLKNDLAIVAAILVVLALTRTNQLRVNETRR